MPVSPTRRTHTSTPSPGKRRARYSSESLALQQYEIRWANMPEPIGRRPVLLLSRTPAYEYLNKVIVAEITTTIRETVKDDGLLIAVRDVA